MKDNEIIKALDCCSKNNLCQPCPYLGIIHCPEMLQGDALDLINRQKAEIERLNTQVDFLIYECERLDKRNKKTEERCIKEIAEKLTNNLLKELVVDVQ